MGHAQIPDEKLPNTRLQHERELKGWSQEYVAKEIDTSAKNVSRWECGDKPIPYYRQKLCSFFLARMPRNSGFWIRNLATTMVHKRRREKRLVHFKKKVYLYEIL